MTAAFNVLAPGSVPLGPECFLSTTDNRPTPRADSGSLRDTLEPQARRVAGGPPQQGILNGLPRQLQEPGGSIGRLATDARLRNVETMDFWAHPSMPVRVQRLPSFAGGPDSVVVTGTVPRYLAAQLAASDDAMPQGDPIVMSFTLTTRGKTTSVESPTFRSGEDERAPTQPAYAFAESRAVNQALAALLATAAPEVIAADPLLQGLNARLTEITDFENGSEPGAGAARLVHRAGWVQRAQAEDIARALGPIYDCRIEPQVPSMVDELRERPVAEALLTAALAAKRLDPALLYAFTHDEGLGREVESWHRGVADLELPRRFEATRIFGLTAIADETAALRRDGYLPTWFDGAVKVEKGETTFVATAGRNALTNAMTFMAARLANARDQSLAIFGRVAGNRAGELDQRTGTFLALLNADGGATAVTRYLQSRAGKPLLPSADDLRADGTVARAFMRTASWEQMFRTGAFEGATP